MPFQQKPTIFCILFLLGIFIPSVAFSAQDDDSSTANAKRALSQSTLGARQFPWYSAETDDAAFVPFPKERECKAPPVRDTSSFWNFFAQMSYWTLFGIGLIVLAFLLVLAWYVVYRNKDLFRKLWKKDEYQERIRRIETLPEEARDMFDDLIGAAKRAMEAGDYRTALIYYFSHQLVWLDMHELIRMHKGKTNHEYARELVVWPAPLTETERLPATEVLGYYEESMSLFESMYYGDHPITRLQFLGLWEDRQEFSLAVQEEKRRRDEMKHTPSFGTGVTSHRDSFTMTVDLPEMRQDAGADKGEQNSKQQASGTQRPGTQTSETWTLLFAFVTAMMLFGTIGCRQEVQTAYVPPPNFDKSLNGISVFNAMTTRRGHALRTETVINAYAKNCDVLIWFARRTGCPKEETVTQIEDWLAAKPGRTFVYVGRAFESTANYWSAVEEQNLAPTEEDRRKIAYQKNEAENELRPFLGKPSPGNTPNNDKQNLPRDNPFGVYDLDRFQKIGQNAECSWFETEPCETPYQVTAIAGAPEWTRDMDADKLHLTCFEDWGFADDVESLLVVNGEAVGERTLVARKNVGESQAIFVTHAGFLLNYPLVNHEHRKLAGRLIDTFGSPKKRICVYIGYSEIDFDRPDTPEEAPFLLMLLHLWPLSVILFHVIVLCAAFCFYKWPIFGRPRKLEEPSVTDFGKHINAYAELLSEAKEDDYAIKQIIEAYTITN